MLFVDKSYGRLIIIYGRMFTGNSALLESGGRTDRWIGGEGFRTITGIKFRIE